MGSTNKNSEAGRDEKCQGILFINHIGNELRMFNSRRTGQPRARVGSRIEGLISGNKASKTLSPQLHMVWRMLLMPFLRSLTTNLVDMLETSRLFKLIGFRQAILCQVLHILHRQLRQLLGGFHVRHVFVVALCEDQVDFFEGAVRYF